MLEKTLLDNAMRRVKVGKLKVTYWDGETCSYGKGEDRGHITIHSPRVLHKLIRSATLGFGEAFMDGGITVEGDVIDVVRFADENRAAMTNLAKLGPLFRKRQKNRRSRQAGQIQHHYDLGNDFYKLWLDESMTYSCAYFKRQNDSLERAQQQKLDHILRKLQLKPGMTLLDIGSGWGQLLLKAVQEYGVTGHGITLSHEQLKLSQARAKELGLEKKLTFELINYQDLAERGKLKFDRIVSVGMFEHVGRGNHRDYFAAVDKLLARDGITVLHSITSQFSELTDPWIDKYIFPGGYLPTVGEVGNIYPDFNFRLTDYENLRIHYAKTLHEWRRRYHSHRNKIVSMYDERFYRMWDLWLAGSEAGFEWGDLSLSQFVFSKGVNNDLPLTRDYLYK